MALVPARAGSVRLPGKNVRPLAGMPLIEHTLRCASLCASIDRITVSTDDPAVVELARAAGADVIARPLALATSDATTWSVVRHAADALGRFATLVLLQPTSPLRLPDDVEGVLALLESSPEADGVVSVRSAGEERVNGAVYAWRAAFVRREPERWQAGRILHLPMPPERSIDIDDQADLDNAETLLADGVVKLPWLADRPSTRGT